MTFFDLQKSLKSLATSLESNEHPLIKDADTVNPEALKIVAEALVLASDVFKSASNELEKLAFSGLNIYDVLDTNTLDEIMAIATEFDKSGDPVLQKQAEVLDQLLMSLAIPQNAKEKSKQALDDEIDRLKKAKAAKNQPPIKESFDKKNVVKAIKEQVKEFRPLEAPLNTRTCPDHPGVLVRRVEENTYQCVLDNKIYNYKDGFTTLKGNKIPGGDIDLQSKTMNDQINTKLNFSTREEMMGRTK